MRQERWAVPISPRFLDKTLVNPSCVVSARIGRKSEASIGWADTGSPTLAFAALTRWASPCSAQPTRQVWRRHPIPSESPIFPSPSGGFRRVCLSPAGASYAAAQTGSEKLGTRRATKRGGLSLVTFFAQTKKVTRRRAPPAKRPSQTAIGDSKERPSLSPALPPRGREKTLSG